MMFLELISSKAALNRTLRSEARVKEEKRIKVKRSRWIVVTLLQTDNQISSHFHTVPFKRESKCCNSEALEEVGRNSSLPDSSV